MLHVSETPETPEVLPPASYAKVTQILEAALERNAEMPLVLDIRAVTSFADTFVLLSGR